MWLSELADDGGFTPLINAAWRGDSHQCKTVYLSIRTGDFPTVRLLLQAGARTARKGAAAPSNTLHIYGICLYDRRLNSDMDRNSMSKTAAESTEMRCCRNVPHK